VEGLSSHPVEDGLNILDFAIFKTFEFGDNSILSWFQNTVEPAEHGHGKHHIFVLIGSVWSAQKIGD
jgi:hypothetical protein